MGKVTIKFWNIEREEYVESLVTRYMVDEDGYVVSSMHGGGGRWIENDSSPKHIEPHFFKDGERIA